MHMTMAMSEAGVSVVTFDLKTFHNMASINKHVRVIKNVLFFSKFIQPHTHMYSSHRKKPYTFFKRL